MWRRVRASAKGGRGGRLSWCSARTAVRTVVVVEGDQEILFKWNRPKIFIMRVSCFFVFVLPLWQQQKSFGFPPPPLYVYIYIYMYAVVIHCHRHRRKWPDDNLHYSSTYNIYELMYITNIYTHWFACTCSMRFSKYAHAVCWN